MVRAPACERSVTVEAEQRPAGLHRRRGVHQVAADRPKRSRGVRADDPARIGERRQPRTRDRMSSELGVRDERAELQGSARFVDPPQLLKPMNRHEAVRKRRFALPRADHQIGAAGDDAGAARQLAHGVLDTGCHHQ
jgi:hypothetical protein